MRLKDRPICPGFHCAHNVDVMAQQRVYWDWEGSEWWPSEYWLCTACADDLEDWFVGGNWDRSPLHYSRTPIGDV